MTSSKSMTVLRFAMLFKDFTKNWSFRARNGLDQIRMLLEERFERFRQAS